MSAIESITSGISGFLKLTVYPAVFSLIAFAWLNTYTFAVLTILLITDFVTAIIREWTIDPTRIKSRVAIIWLISKSLVLIIPLLLGSIGATTNLPFKMDAFVEVVMTLLIVSEWYSVVGNIIQIREKDSTINEYDAITSVMRFIQHSLKSILEKLFPNQEK